jgi:hypothetical protein
MILALYFNFILFRNHASCCRTNSEDTLSSGPGVIRGRFNIFPQYLTLALLIFIFCLFVYLFIALLLKHRYIYVYCRGLLDERRRYQLVVQRTLLCSIPKKTCLFQKAEGSSFLVRISEHCLLAARIAKASRRSRQKCWRNRSKCRGSR